MLDHVGKCWMKFDFNQTFVPTSSNISHVFLMFEWFEYTDGFSAVCYAIVLFKTY